MGHQEAHCASLDLVLTGCVRRELGPHRVGDSLVHCLSGSLARLLRLRKGGDYSTIGRRDERIEEITFSRLAKIGFLRFVI